MHRGRAQKADSASADAPPLPPLADSALFLDLDGTLAPISPRPEDVKPEVWRTDLLRRLGKALGGRVAVVSGRALADVDRILDRAVEAVAGVHGLELRLPGRGVWRAQPSASLAAARDSLESLVERWPGIRIEDKALSIAAHFRAAPEAGASVRTLTERLARELGLVLQPGDMVAELRTPGPDKGGAVRALMAEAPFAGARPVFVGDDLTDERGFAAAAAMDGYGVLVGPPRETRATARLADVAAVRDWLEAALAVQGRR
ncbi:MAG TPA: trehalose-phosphatase [Caulobacteraceae bacterium]|nr:trehalose-phosphatase [Caulobacteraceae bacterium]